MTSSKVIYGVVILLAIPAFILGVACTIWAAIIEVYAPTAVVLYKTDYHLGCPNYPVSLHS